MNNPTYRLRFFFDYNCGGCLWCDNDASYQKFDVGVLDSEIYDLNGNIVQEAKIKLPSLIRQRVLELDKLYTESLNWNDPSGQSLWDKAQWESFYEQTRDLHKQISLALGDDFKIVYKQT
ncbi:hypothetical protein [Cellulophaga sp. BC115SP]|uniref:hypothetical protein n=1 Tax=Cellulophaga sp. BC115SP TaxID=2683263 RepID=UPI0014124CAE|nr:hypothetical protein [Cellulophaga sp. BC115SP]NBB26979.1 hypothetical protein [Cellulophaga sp. BC115SP]